MEPSVESAPKDIEVININDLNRSSMDFGENVKSLFHMMEKSMANESIRLIILEVNNSADEDLVECGTSGTSKLTDFRNGVSVLSDLIRIIMTGPKPVIAAVGNDIAGLAVSCVLGCDYIVGSNAAKYRFDALAAGLIPPGGQMWTLAKRIGYAKAREFLLLAKEITSEEAFSTGFVNEMTDSDNALRAAYTYAEKLLKNPPLSLTLIKAALANGTDTLEMSLKTEADYQPILRHSQDHLEATNAFMEKRLPSFTGN